ncbi:hypothetical protein MMC19_003604 [Ptychographa xylographoides]|nr:hypothetical protein [Ptychographa xylographoides]
MNIICPSGSYDPNIEPSKDDVLFTDPDEVLRIIKSFFVSIYGERDMPARRSPQSDSRTPQQHDFDLLLHQRPTPAWTERDRSTTTKKEITSNRASEEIHNPLHGRSTDATDMEFSVACALPTSTIANCNTADQSEQQLSESVQAWKPNMYDQDGFDECNDESGSESVTMIETEDQEVRSRDLEGLNPWTIAKLNAPIKSLRSMGEAADRCDATCKQLLTPARTRTDYHASSSPGLEATSRESTAIFTNKLLSPRSSPTTARPVVQASQPPTVLPFSTNPRSTNTKTTSNALYDPTEQYNLIRNNGQSLRETAPSDGFVSARDLPTGTPLNEIPDISQRPRKQPHRKQHWQQEQGRLNKAFKLPPHGSQACSTELSHTEQLRLDTYGQQATLHLSSSLSLQSDLGRSSPKAATSGDSDSRGRPIHPDLVLTLDFERRKAIATQKRKEFLRQQSLNITKPASSSEPGSRPLTPNSPHRNRYNKAIATLNSAISPAIPPVSIFEPGDPRGNLARSLSTNTASSHHASAGTHKLKRRKTATLPLETVPETEATHELIHTVTTTARTATARAAAIAPYDDYVRAGHLTAPSGLDCTLEEAQVWQATLQRIVKSLFVGEDGGRKDVGIELWPVLQGRRLACAFP